jgi:hypothetical protein
MLFKKTILTAIVIIAGHCYGNINIPENDSGIVTITLQNISDKLSKIDSVFVIFDRYDLRGAGIIKQVFYPGIANQIRIILPEGKYYLNIYCLGIYNKEAFDRIVSAKSKKNHKISLRLQQSALFQLGRARMPADHFDPAHLAIFNFGTK